MKKIPLGIRNNNPLNIRRVKGQKWKGEVPFPPPSEGTGEAVPSEGTGEVEALPPPKGGGGSWSGEGAFVRFSSLPWGIRATFCILDTYRKKYNATCVEDIIARWAPPSENDTKRYVQTVCRLTGFGGKERLSENEWPKLVRAMATVESGATLEDRDMELGVQLYQMLNQKQPKK